MQKLSIDRPPNAQAFVAALVRTHGLKITHAGRLKSQGGAEHFHLARPGERGVLELTVTADAA